MNAGSLESAPKCSWPDSRVLVTGGTGSFGNFVVQHLLRLGAKEVRVLSRDEKKQHDMRVFHKQRADLQLIIGDIRDYDTVRSDMEDIDVVFHAAALKQVPACENHPIESIRTNVLGAENVVQAALAQRVKKLVAISTDKAVKPVNVMGMSKSLQERLVLHGNRSRANHGTQLACVRYGNVLLSRGSVIPLFRRQLESNLPLTITDERMTRFLLTLGDAIGLVLHAAEDMTGGEIYARRAASSRIVDLADAVSRIAETPFQYNIIGILAGEKLDEILVSEEELARTEDCGEFIKIHPVWREGNYQDLKAEMSSLDHLISVEKIEAMIRRADEEMKSLRMVDGEFSRF